MYMLISMFINAKESKKYRRHRIFETYEALSNLQLSLATPILLNLRKINANLSSCFITAIDDNIESIYSYNDILSKIEDIMAGI